MKKDFSIYLEDIIESITHIEKYTQGVTFEQFEKDEYMQDAVIRRFEIIGEAAKRIPDDVKQTHSEIPWKLVTGMRDVLIHNYNEVNLDRVWKTLTKDLPLLKSLLVPLVVGDIIPEK